MTDAKPLDVIDRAADLTLRAPPEAFIYLRNVRIVDVPVLDRLNSLEPFFEVHLQLAVEKRIRRDRR